MLQIRPENLGFAVELEKLQDTIQNFKEWVIVEYFTNILEQWIPPYMYLFYRSSMV